MREVLPETLPQIPIADQQAEYVERKGPGHPDSICDALMESISTALSRAYVEAAGRVLHDNLDKGFLVAGQTLPAHGGGRVDAPMRIVFGDRATANYPGGSNPVGEIAQETAKKWVADHLRLVDPEKHVRFQKRPFGRTVAVTIPSRRQP